MTQAPKSEEPKSQDKEKPSFNDKLADIALKVIMTGGAAGGTIGAGWSLFKESDVPKAIASAVIGLGISYAAKMLQPIHKGTEKRLEDTGKAIDGAIEENINQLIGHWFRWIGKSSETPLVSGFRQFGLKMAEILVTQGLQTNNPIQRNQCQEITHARTVVSTL